MDFVKQDNDSAKGRRMGKGKPAPRETAKEKKTSAQKAVPAKASAKKAVPAPQSKKPSAPKKAQKAEPEKSAVASGPSEPPAKARSESAPAPKPQGKPPAAPQRVEKPAPPVGEPVVYKQAVQAPPPETGEPLQKAQAAGPEEMEGVRLPAGSGKVGVFGGPRDRSVKPDDKLGLPTGRHYQFEQFRTLNPKSYYCAMRWEYRQQHMSAEEGKRWWANKKIAVTNPANNKTVVVRAVDYGPHENTGLAIAISPGAAEAIGIETGQEVVIAFADEKAQLGLLTGPAGSN